MEKEKKYKVELSGKEAFALWKLTINSPRTTGVLKWKLFGLLNQKERIKQRIRWEKGNLI